MVFKVRVVRGPRLTFSVAEVEVLVQALFPLNRDTLAQGALVLKVLVVADRRCWKERAEVQYLADQIRRQKSNRAGSTIQVHPPYCSNLLHSLSKSWGEPLWWPCMSTFIWASSISRLRILSRWRNSNRLQVIFDLVPHETKNTKDVLKQKSKKICQD